MIIFVYVVLVFLVLRFSVTLFNFLSNPTLGHYGKKFDDKISIIICPSLSGNEDLTASISVQDYKNVEVLQVETSDGLDATATLATGKYLLFIDSNTVIKKGLLNSLVYRTKVFNLKYIALIPKRSPLTFYDFLVLPLTDYVILNLLPLRLVRLLNLPSLGANNGRYLFYNAESYRIKMVGSVAEDEKKAETLLANGMMVSHKKLSMNEASKELMRIFDGNLLSIGLYILLLMAGPLFLLLNFKLALITLPLGLIFLTRVMTSFLTKQNPLVHVLLHPLQMVTMTYLLILGAANVLFTSRKHS